MASTPRTRARRRRLNRLIARASWRNARKIAVLAALVAPASWGNNATVVDFDTWPEHGKCVFIWFERPGPDVRSIWCQDGHRESWRG